MNYLIEHNPTTQQLAELKEWLVAEKNNSGEGFYCNWSLITKFFERNELAILLQESNSIGFCCWRKTSEHSGQINIFEIRPEYRSSGAGKWFVNAIEEFFISKNVFVIDLHCEPEESEKFWRKINFLDVPKGVSYWRAESINLFKRLVPNHPEVALHNETNYIELWDEEPVYSRLKQPAWKWNIENAEHPQLALPIIQPCEKDWRIRFVVGGKVIFDDKIKKNPGSEILFGPYAIIKKIHFGN